MTYFSVDYTGVKGKYNNLYEMEAVLREFQNETGIVMSVLPTVEEEAINKIISGETTNTQNLSLIHEEVLWKNMTEEERSDKLLEYIKKIEGIENEIIIVDPYFFPKNCDDEYENFIIKTIQKAKLKMLTIVVDKRNVNDSLREKIIEDAGCAVEIKYSEEFHDRFWISRNSFKCFVVGTSLNGIGKKICIIELLTDENDEKDIKEIIKMIDEIR